MATHPAGINPTDLAAMKTSAMQTVGGANAGAVGQGSLLSARTGNAGTADAAIAKSGESAGQTLSKANLGTDLANQNLKQEQQNTGIKGLENLYGTNESQALGGLNASTSALKGAGEAPPNSSGSSWPSNTGWTSSTTLPVGEPAPSPARGTNGLQSRTPTKFTDSPTRAKAALGMAGHTLPPIDPGMNTPPILKPGTLAPASDAAPSLVSMPHPTPTLTAGPQPPIEAPLGTIAGDEARRSTAARPEARSGEHRQVSSKARGSGQAHPLAGEDFPAAWLKALECSETRYSSAALPGLERQASAGTEG